MNVNKFFPSLLVVFAILFGACTAKPADIQTENPNVTLTGTVIQAGGGYSLRGETGTTVLESRQINLGQYAGKPVTVTGQYSGTTLFVDKVE